MSSKNRHPTDHDNKKNGNNDIPISEEKKETPVNEFDACSSPDAEEKKNAETVTDTDETAAAPEPRPDSKSLMEAQLKAEKDKYLRMLAEYDNYRKRSAKERESIFSDVRADTVLRFLPVYDNIARALEQPTEDTAYRRGIEMIMTQFLEILSCLGVVPIETVGKTFDPCLHDAVMHEENAEKGENEIVLELQKGFMMGDKVIRFAMVKVAN